MTKRDSERICAQIASYIASGERILLPSPKETKKCLNAETEDMRRHLAERGIDSEDPQVRLVLSRLLKDTGLEDTEPEYLRLLSKKAKRLSMQAFYENPYLRAVQVSDMRVSRFFLTEQSYERGELLQYEMPDLLADPTVLSIGFFDAKVRFPSIYEGATPWMSVCPSEISSMQEPIERAHGRTLVLGLGLGYYPFMISLRDQVGEITVIERERAVISLFEAQILPHFPHPDRIRILCDDALHYLDSVQDGDFDFCFADIWEGVHDGAPLYERIKAQEARLAHTEFSYWIEDQICAYLSL